MMRHVAYLSFAAPMRPPAGIGPLGGFALAIAPLGCFALAIAPLGCFALAIAPLGGFALAIRQLARLAPPIAPLACFALAMLAALGGVARAAGPPLQADVAATVPGASGASVTLAADLDGGGAGFAARVVNRDDLRTATVHLRFTYRVPPDTIALDEIIDRIVVETRALDGARFGRTVIVPNEVNLNPNGPSLVYRLTMYRPEGEYRARIRVFGNYE